jgi:hypothetical protein
VLRSDDGQWAPVASYRGSQTVHAVPFEAVDLRLGWLWGDDE